MKLINDVPNPGLIEISHGTEEVRFALFDDKTGKTITCFVRCKDYFGDLFHAHVNKDSISIYGFRWKGGDHKEVLDRDYIYIACNVAPRNNAKALIKVKDEQFEGVKVIVSQFAKALTKKKLKMCEIAEDGNHILLGVPRKLFEVPYVLSALFLVIRLGYTFDPKEDPMKFFSNPKAKFISPSDAVYLNSAKDVLTDLFNGKIDPNHRSYEWSQGKDSSTIHNNIGIVAHAQEVKQRKKEKVTA